MTIVYSKIITFDFRAKVPFFYEKMIVSSLSLM